jgi:hypothetical protein
MKKLFTTLTMAIIGIAVAQETEPTFSLSGTVDTYFRSSENAPGTSFANLPGFSLGMANLIFAYEGEDHGFVADLVMGPRGTEAVFNSFGSSNMVNQLYVYYNLSDSVTLTFGNFNTFLGYEVISPAANFNYSTSYLFSYGPFSHTGLKLDAALSDDISLMLGVMNQTDYTEGNFDSAGNGDAFDKYMFGAQLGLYGQYLNLLAGEDYTQIDYTGGFDLSEGFYLGINASKASLADGAEFSGVALYPQIGLSEDFSIGLRGELFKDNGAGILGDGELDNTSLTLTGSYSSGNFTFKPEFRLDKGSEAFYVNESGSTDSLSSFVLAAIYSF